MLISRTLVKDPEWATARKPILWVAHLTWISPLLLAASFVVMVVTFQLALGALPAAPPKQLPSGVIAVVGWPDRLLIVSAWTWVAIVAVQAIRAARRQSRLRRSILRTRDPQFGPGGSSR